MNQFQAPGLRITRLSLDNMRCFNHLSIDFTEEKNCTIILADNGSGKTTAIDSIAKLLSLFCGQFPGGKKIVVSESDLRIEGQRRCEHLSLHAHLIYDHRPLEVQLIHRRDNTIKLENRVGVKQLTSIADQLLRSHEAGETPSFPVLAYYSTGRGYLQSPERRRDFQSIYSPWDAYVSALHSDSDFKRFFMWFDSMEDQERREMSRLRDFEYKLPALQAVRKVIEELLVGYKNPKIEMRPLRFVIDKIDSNGLSSKLRIEQLSDGYRMVLAMIADIASRMAEANPHLLDPNQILQVPGIVLVDEIDQHLHPKWQRTIISSLTRTFPNVQFIVSTHSPLVALNATEIAQIIRLSAEPLDENLQLDDFRTYNVSQILTSSLFGLPSDRSERWDIPLHRREDLLALTELNEELSLLSYGHSAEEIESRRFLVDLAKKLQSKEYDKD